MPNISPYQSVEVSETQLEDLIRQMPDTIEEGLRFIDHQRMTERGPLDLLMIDSGNTLVVAELKIIEDDAMLMQGVDYYDFISKNIERIARAYQNFHIDPNKTTRLFLIAPSFSVSLINRCKWVNMPISLFTYKCIALSSEKNVPVFNEVSIPSTPEIITTYDLRDRIEYITNLDMREIATELINEIKNWDTANILIEPTRYDISAKISGRVFAYILPRRNNFRIYIPRNRTQEEANLLINQKEDLEPARILLKANIDRLR